LGSYCKIVTLILVLCLSIPAVLISPIANCQVINGWDITYSLKLSSPNNQTMYSVTMPLNFSITWTANLMAGIVGQVSGFYSYRIDSNSLVSIASNQSSNDLYGFNNFKWNPSFSYLVNISELTNGQHTLVIYGSMHGDNVGQLYAFSSPVEFFVQNPTPSPMPTPKTSVPVSLTTVSITVVVLVLMVAIVSLMVYRKHRKQ